MENYLKEEREYIEISRNELGEIVKIASKPNATIEQSISEAVRYLNDVKETKNCLFAYKRAKFPISAKTDSSKLVRKFIENYNHVTQDVFVGLM